MVSVLIFCVASLVPHNLHFGAFCWFSAFNGPRYSAEVLSHAPKLRKSVMCLMEKMHVSDTLPSGVSHSAAAPKFM